MPDSELIAAIALDLLAILGGSAFVWRLVDLYRDRVRVDVSDVRYQENGEGLRRHGFEEVRLHHPTIGLAEECLRGGFVSLGNLRAREYLLGAIRPTSRVPSLGPRTNPEPDILAAIGRQLPSTEAG